jgi:predicted nucleotidyltransferase
MLNYEGLFLTDNRKSDSDIDINIILGKCMKRHLQNFIQQLVLNTRFPPFTLLYRLAYSLSCKLAVASLKDIPGVVSIYLRRGLASGEIIYSLSDIDLMVLLDDKFACHRDRVFKTYDRLSGLIPLFGEKEKELGVHSISEFRHLYEEHSSYRYRFDEGKSQWILLFGENIVGTLAPLKNKEINFLAVEEFKVWWAFLLADFDTGTIMPLFKRKYLWYKAIAEAAKIYLLVIHRNKIHSRKIALNEIQKYLPAEFQPVLRITQEYVKSLTNSRPVLSEESFRLFIWLTTQSFNQLENGTEILDQRFPAITGLSIQDKELLNIHHQNIMNGFKSLSGDIDPAIEKIALIPRCEFDIDVLENSDIDSYYLVIIFKSVPSINTLNSLSNAFKNSPDLSGLPIFLVFNQKLALSLSSTSPQYGIKSPVNDPLFFSLLNSLDMSRFYLPDNFERNLLNRQKRILTTLSNSDIYKIRNLDFCRFFWASARTRLILDSRRSPELTIPLNSRQISGRLTLDYPEKAPLINKFYQEYVKELANQNSEIHALFTEAIDFLYSIEK